MFVRHVCRIPRIAKLLRKSILPHSLRLFDQHSNQFHFSRYLLGYDSSEVKQYPNFESRGSHEEPPGFVASHRWFQHRPVNASLETVLFGPSSVKPIDKHYMSVKLNAAVSGSPIRDGFSYPELQTLSDIPLLDQRLAENLRRMGLDELTPVQRHAISILSFDESVPVGSENFDRVVGQYDLMAAAQTGSGKTLAYLIPIINRLLRVYPYEAMQNTLKNPPCQFPSGLVLAPTRELVQQIRDVTTKLSFRTFHRAVAVYGGEPPSRQQREIHMGCHLAIATPGRLLDFMRRGLISLENCRSLVLDEADRMLDMGFEDALREILESKNFGMPPSRDSERQTCLFSATFPREVALIARQFLRGSRCISLTLNDQDFGAVVPEWGESVKKSSKTDELDRLRHIVPREITQQFRFVSNPSPDGLARFLTDLVKTLTDEALMSESTDSEIKVPVRRPARILMFCNTKIEVDHFDNVLYRRGIKTVGIHGDKSQDQRSRAIEAFKNGSVNVMVASSVAARGLDIPDVTAVINVGFPREAEEYVHRIGRTGRMGNRGAAITVVNQQNLSQASSSVVKAILNMAESSAGSLEPVPAPILEFLQSGASFEPRNRNRSASRSPETRRQFSNAPRDRGYYNKWKY